MIHASINSISTKHNYGESPNHSCNHDPPLQKSKQLRAFSMGVCSPITTENSIFCQAAIFGAPVPFWFLKLHYISDIQKGAMPTRVNTLICTNQPKKEALQICLNLWSHPPFSVETKIRFWFLSFPSLPFYIHFVSFKLCSIVFIYYMLIKGLICVSFRCLVSITFWYVFASDIYL